jgi:hypothetical protein
MVSTFLEWLMFYYLTENCLFNSMKLFANVISSFEDLKWRFDPEKANRKELLIISYKITLKTPYDSTAHLGEIFLHPVMVDTGES